MQTPPPVQETKDRKNGRTEAFYASQSDDSGEQLIACLDAGVEINAIDDLGDTVLHWTAWNRRWKALDILLARGADPNIQNAKGSTPLHHVLARAAPEALETLVVQLLNRGADPRLGERGGKSAYHCLAVGRRDLSMAIVCNLARILTDRYPDGWNMPDGQGKTAFDYARSQSDPQLAGMLAGLQGSVLDHSTALSPQKKSTNRRL